MVRVRVRLFASLREAVGRDQIDLDLPEGATAEDAWARLVAECPAVAPRRRSLSAAVNRRYSPFDAPLAAGDEVVFVPPVSGG
jgi:molybdopterin converting factor subunit 1